MTKVDCLVWTLDSGHIQYSNVRRERNETKLKKKKKNFCLHSTIETCKVIDMYSRHVIHIEMCACATGMACHFDVARKRKKEEKHR